MAAPFKTRKGILKSSGAGDAGKVPLLNDEGRLDDSFLRMRNVQAGSATAPNSGTHSTTRTVSFPVAYDNAPRVIPVLRQAQICLAGVPGTLAITAITATGFTFTVNTNVDDTNSIWDINVEPLIDWFAFEV